MGGGPELTFTASSFATSVIRRPTYGQTNFDFMFEFLYYQIQEQQRPVGFYPETSYWVNYDNEVSNSFAESRQSLTRSTVVKVPLAHLSTGPAVPTGVRVSTASRPSRHCSPRGTLSQARPTFGLGQIAHTCSVVHPFFALPVDPDCPGRQDGRAECLRFGLGVGLLAAGRHSCARRLEPVHAAGFRNGPAAK